MWCFALRTLAFLGMMHAACGTIPLAVSKYFELQNSKNCTAWADLFHEPFAVTDPYGSAPINDKDTLIAGCEGGAALFKTISITPLQTYPVGDAVAVQFHVQSVAPAKSGGRDCALNFKGIDTFRTTKDGTKLVSVTGYYDTSIPDRQLLSCLSHYGSQPCLSDESAIQLAGISGTFCAPPCNGGTVCPEDVPNGATATPTCVLFQDSSGEEYKYCALQCTDSAKGECGEGSCNNVGGTVGGICMYDTTVTPDKMFKIAQQ